jgi:uncharacterized protein YbaR (Trm112 family)
MRDALSLGATPYGETCAAVGQEDYRKRARVECRAYIGQLTRMFGEPPDGCRLIIRSCPHDFGSYLDVEAVFDSDNEPAVRFAYRLEDGVPELWDAEAREELGMEVSDANG